jgi:CBS domain-containing protein
MPDSTPVSTIMTTDVVTLAPDQSVPEAADVLADHTIGAAPVVDADGKLVGLLRDDDLIISESRLHVPTMIEILGVGVVWPPSERRWEHELKKAAASTVADVMTTEFETVMPTESIETVATLMHDKGLSHVPVVDGGKLVGIVSRGDLVRYLAATT